MLEQGLVLALVMVLRAGQGVRHRVNAQCRARSGRVNNRSGRARFRCSARTGCTAKARAKVKVVPARELTVFHGTTHNLCFLRLAPAQGSDPKEVRSAPAKGQGQSKEAKRQRSKEGKTRKKEERHP